MLFAVNTTYNTHATHSYMCENKKKCRFLFFYLPPPPHYPILRPPFLRLRCAVLHIFLFFNRLKRTLLAVSKLYSSPFAFFFFCQTGFLYPLRELPDCTSVLCNYRRSSARARLRSLSLCGRRVYLFYLIACCGPLLITLLIIEAAFWKGIFSYKSDIWEISFFFNF